MNDSCSDESIQEQLSRCGIYSSAQLAEKSSKDKSLSSLQICVEKELPDTRRNILQMASMSGEDINVVSAAYFKSKIWPENKKTLSIQFLEEGNNVPWSDFGMYQNTRKIYQLERELNSSITNQYRPRNIRRTSGKEAVIQTVTKILQPLVGIKFKFLLTNQEVINYIKENKKQPDIRIGFNTNEGASSYVGTDCENMPGKTMNLGWLDVATIIHEFLHALGCIHEHQNPKGGIPWNNCVVYQWAKIRQGWNPEQTCTNILDKYSVDQLNASSYDPESIMLYYFPSDLTTNKTEVKKNTILSRTDIKWLMDIYPGGTGLTDEHIGIFPNQQITKKIGTGGKVPLPDYKKLSCLTSCNDSYVARIRNCNKLKGNYKLGCLSRELKRKVDCINKCNIQSNMRSNTVQSNTQSDNTNPDQKGDKEGDNKKGMHPVFIVLIIIAVIIMLMIIYVIFFDKGNKNTYTKSNVNISTGTTAGLFFN